MTTQNPWLTPGIPDPSILEKIKAAEEALKNLQEALTGTNSITTDALANSVYTMRTNINQFAGRLYPDPDRATRKLGGVA